MKRTNEVIKAVSRLQNPKGCPAPDYTSRIYGAISAPNLTKNFNATEELVRIETCFCSKPHKPYCFGIKRVVVPRSITAHEVSGQNLRILLQVQEQSIYMPYTKCPITSAKGQGSSANETHLNRHVSLKGGPYISNYFPRTIMLVHDDACLRRQPFLTNT